MTWIPEEIANDQRLYYRVHRALISGRGVHAGIFREKNGSMSTDWERYSTPEEARHRAKEYQANGILTLISGEVRSIEGASVFHTPDVNLGNRAHTDILGVSGMNKERIRLELYNQVKDRGWTIPPDAPA